MTKFKVWVGEMIVRWFERHGLTIIFIEELDAPKAQNSALREALGACCAMDKHAMKLKYSILKPEEMP